MPPIDTTVVNGRFVTPDGIMDRPISIHHGAVLPAPELEDVWRTVDASGFYVLPGLVQPGSITGDDALGSARQGVTIAMPESSPDNVLQDVDASFDYLPVLDVTHVDLVELESLNSAASRIVICRVPRPELREWLADRTVILGGPALLPERWITPAGERLIVRVGSDPVPETWFEHASMVQVPLSLLAEDADLAWRFVEDELASVHVIIDRPELPLLQILAYRDGSQRHVTFERIAAVTSSIPATIFGINASKGHFDAGGHGDLLVFDPEAQDTYRPTPWPGRVILSLQRGELLYYNGQIHANAGSGRNLGLIDGP